MAVSCRDVTSWNLTDQCTFVRSVPSCEPNMGFVDYLELIYCMMGPANHFYAVGLSVVWLLMLFVALGITSGDFLTPALFVISKTLHMSQNVAGVTLLAFGNGSPDIFSSLAGIRQGSYELVIGGLIGGGIFVTTVVAGSVFLTQPFKLAARPFLRDCIFYSVAGAWAFYLFFTGSISIMHAIGFICLYCAYILLVVVSGIIYQKYMSDASEKEEQEEEKKEKSPEKGRLQSPASVPGWTEIAKPQGTRMRTAAPCVDPPRPVSLPLAVGAATVLLRRGSGLHPHNTMTPAAKRWTPCFGAFAP